MVVAFLAEQNLAAHPLLRFGGVTESRTARHNVVKVFHVLGRDGLVVVSILLEAVVLLAVGAVPAVAVPVRHHRVLIAEPAVHRHVRGLLPVGRGNVSGRSTELS